MPALLVLNYDVHDAAALATYREKAAPIVLAGTARLLTSTAATHHLGEVQSGGTHTVVICFRSTVEAIRRYESDDYQHLLHARLAATTPHAAFVVEVTDPSVLAAYAR